MMTPKFKKIAALLIAISAIFVDSAHPQAARTVMVNSNTGVLLFPTNLWSANAANARSGFSLGSAATNPASAFQPSSTILSNLASSNGAGLTNLTAANVTGAISIINGGTGATNAAAARANLGLGDTNNVTFSSAVFNGGISINGNEIAWESGLLFDLETRYIYDIWNFQSAPTFANAAGTRTNLGLGASDTVRFNAIWLQQDGEQSNNISYWTEGMQFKTAGATYFETENYDGGRVNFYKPLYFPTNINLASITRTNLGLPLAALTNNNVTNFRTAIELGTTNNVKFNSVTAGGAVYANTFESTNYGSLFDVDSADTINIQKALGFSTNIAAATRINLGLGAAWLTNTNVTNFRSDIGLGSAATNSASAFQPSSSVLSNLANNNGASLTNITVSNLGTISVVNGGTGATNAATARTNLGLGMTNNVIFNDVQAQAFLVGDETNSSIYFEGDSAARTRTNLGLGWSALTNSNAGTGLVSVNTNGQVVSPTNFWQVAPIQTLVQSIIPVTNSTNAATNARNLYAYSLATNIINVTNTITLPTNTSVFDGDEVTVVHRGGSNSVTAVRQLGSTNNLISLNSYDESVKFIKDGNWDFYHNISFTEAIRFSGTNAAANAAASRTNLGLGTTNSIEFADITISQLAAVQSLNVTADLNIGNGGIINIADGYGISFHTNAASATRTNLGIPLAALTNTSTTNFQKAIFYTNTAPSNIGGNLGSIAAWIEIVASNGVTYKVPAYTNIP